MHIAIGKEAGNKAGVGRGVGEWVLRGGKEMTIKVRRCREGDERNGGRVW